MVHNIMNIIILFKLSDNQTSVVRVGVYVRNASQMTAALTRTTQ